MEGSGSRQSRAASRYASSPSPPVFSGPVRKWKKQWVSHSTNAAKRNHAPPLLLCRWTPLSAPDDPPKPRRFRYAPIVPIEKGNKKSAEDQSIKNGSDMKSEGEGMQLNTEDFSKEERQEASGDQAE